MNLTRGQRSLCGVTSVGLHLAKTIYQKLRYVTRRGVKKGHIKGQNVVVSVGGAPDKNGHAVSTEVSLHWVATNQQESHQALPKYHA